jgi:hypothetical protein
MKNLSQVANKNTKYISTKQKKVVEKTTKTNSLLNRPNYDKIEENDNLSLKLKNIVTEALT